MNNWVIMTGNPVDGFNIFGTFQDNSEAHDWAENNLTGENYWMFPLSDPKSIDCE